MPRIYYKTSRKQHLFTGDIHKYINDQYIRFILYILDFLQTQCVIHISEWSFHLLKSTQKHWLVYQLPSFLLQGNVIYHHIPAICTITSLSFGLAIRTQNCFSLQTFLFLRIQMHTKILLLLLVLRTILLHLPSTFIC